MDVTWIVIGILIAIVVLVFIIVSVIRNRSDDYGGDYHPYDHRGDTIRLPSDREQQEAFGKYGENVVFQMISEIAKRSGGYALSKHCLQR